MASASEIESVRIIMMAARKTLAEYEARKDARDHKLHMILISAFRKASTKYLHLSAPKS